MSARKSPEDRTRRVEPVYKDLPLYADGRTRGPGLPDGRRWSEATKAWWSTIRHSAQAQQFHQSDWDFLLDTALLHNRMWESTTKPSEATALAGEIRRRTESYGLIWATRRKYGIDVVNGAEEDAAVQEAERTAKTASRVDWRRRLNGLD